MPQLYVGKRIRSVPSLAQLKKSLVILNATMTTLSKLKICAILAVFSGASISFSGYMEKQRDDYFEANHIVTEGSVIRNEVLSKTTARRRTQYYVHHLDVKFHQQQGFPVIKTFAVSPTFYASHTRIANPTVKVKYLAEEPYDSAEIEHREPSLPMYLVGIFIFVAGSGVLIFATLLSRSQTKE
jgi:hypothetical protein